MPLYRVHLKPKPLTPAGFVSLPQGQTDNLYVNADTIANAGQMVLDLLGSDPQVLECVGTLLTSDNAETVRFNAMLKDTESSMVIHRSGHNVFANMIPKPGDPGYDETMDAIKRMGQIIRGENREQDED